MNEMSSAISSLAENRGIGDMNNENLNKVEIVGCTSNKKILGLPF